MPSRDLHMRIAFGEYVVDMTAENQSYSPDVVHDMRTRVLEMFVTGLRELHELDFDPLEDDDEDIEDTEDETTLMEGNTDDA